MNGEKKEGKRKRTSNIEQGISNDEVEKPSNLELNSVLERFFTSLLDILVRYWIFVSMFSMVLFPLKLSTADGSKKWEFFEA